MHGVGTIRGPSRGLFIAVGATVVGIPALIIAQAATSGTAGIPRCPAVGSAGDVVGAHFLVESEDGVHQGLGSRGAPRSVDVHGDDLVDALNDGVVIEHASATCANSHRQHPLGLHHLVVDLAEHRGHLLRYPTGHD